MTALPVSGIPVPDNAAAFYLWLLVPAGISGVAATYPEARDAAWRAMDEYSDGHTAAIFTVHLAHDWPYVLLVPDSAYERATRELIKANIARARRQKAQRNAHRRAVRANLRNTPEME